MANPILMRQAQRTALEELKRRLGTFDISSISDLKISLLSTEDIKAILEFIDTAKGRMLAALLEIEEEKKLDQSP